MDLNKFTERSAQAVQEGQLIASKRGHQEVEVEHLLLALATQEEGFVVRILEKIGTPAATLASAVS